MTALRVTRHGVPAYRLSRNDSELREAMPANIAAGYFAADCNPAVFYDKCAQHLAIQALAPELAFAGGAVAALSELAELAAQGTALVVRPTFSAQSKGTALIVGGAGRPGIEAAQQQLRDAPGPFQVHRYESGQPVFINGVFAEGRFVVSDAWRCICLTVGSRQILTAVINLPLEELPANLLPRLAGLAAGMGLIAAPLHVELVLDREVARVVKLSPRLASSPLPELCQFGGWPSQQACWQWTPERQDAAPAVYVADYSFVLLQAGRIAAFHFDREVRALASFSHYFAEPALGQQVQMTVDGDSYGCTVFLKHSEREVLLGDIEVLTALNKVGAFVVEPH